MNMEEALRMLKKDVRVPIPLSVERVEDTGIRCARGRAVNTVCGGACGICAACGACGK